MVGENTPADGPKNSADCDDTQLAGGGKARINPDIVSGGRLSVWKTMLRLYKKL